LIFVTLGAFSALGALAQTEVQTIWNCKDPQGRISVTNIKEDTVGKDCRIVQQQRVNVAPAVPAPKGAAKAPASFPKESANERTSARERQRDILQKELASEQGLLVKAQKQLAEQEAVRTGEERNYAKTLERLQPYRDSVETHQKNIEALRREFANLNR
jgi:hypothetical protein